jgi:hypothetical protein
MRNGYRSERSGPLMAQRRRLDLTLFLLFAGPLLSATSASATASDATKTLALPAAMSKVRV